VAISEKEKDFRSKFERIHKDYEQKIERSYGSVNPSETPNKSPVLPSEDNVN
jgi:hypothetical protein